MENKAIIEKYKILLPHLDERSRRLVAAADTIGQDHGIINKISKASGVSRRALSKGIKELKEEPLHDDEGNTRIRREGGGRKTVIEKDPELIPDLEKILESSVRGDPESPLMWTYKSLRNIVDELSVMGHSITHQTLANLMREMGYSLQGNKKTKNGNQSPDRNEKFEYINNKVIAFHKEEQPVISVDTKKKELAVNYKNNGATWVHNEQTEGVSTDDLDGKVLDKVIPYDIYDLNKNIGWVSVGIDNDTIAFAVTSIKSWWNNMGSIIYPDATKLMITADYGSSNGYRIKLWKTELQSFADLTGLTLHISHLPPGTSKWNKIEHSLFSLISQNWRGKPVISLEVIVNLIAGTTIRKGSSVSCCSDKEIEALDLERESFRGDWNYIIHPVKT